MKEMEAMKFEAWWFGRRRVNPQLNDEGQRMTLTVGHFKAQQRKAYEAGRAEASGGEGRCKSPREFVSDILGGLYGSK